MSSLDCHDTGRKKKSVFGFFNIFLPIQCGDCQCPSWIEGILYRVWRLQNPGVGATEVAANTASSAVHTKVAQLFITRKLIIPVMNGTAIKVL